MKHYRTIVTLSIILLGAFLINGMAIKVNAEVPAFDPDNFDEPAENMYHPLVPGTSWVYLLEDDEGNEMAIYTVGYETEEILGIECAVFTETILVDGLLQEHSVNWFANDNDGNVWYFGEDSKDYVDGEISTTAGSWRAGEGNAMPGIQMLANPEIGDEYFQENAPGTAEDKGAVAELDLVHSVPQGTFNGCLKTRDWNPAEPGSTEFKYYAPGIGLIAEESEDDLELISFVCPKISGAKIEPNEAVVTGGDTLTITAELLNGTDETVTLNEYIIMDYAGIYFFYPSWSAQSEYQTVTLQPEQELEQEIFSFTWPQGVGAIDRVAFWIYLIDAETGLKFGHDGRCEFSAM